MSPAEPTPGAPAHAPKVSVVVPVYNPGPVLDGCVSSLVNQTLPVTDRELIFVDDGSTDDTLARLRRLERDHPEVRVLSIPNSGWPGRPRNVGTDASRGHYVMYVDQDDALEPDALRRMYEFGSDNRADVVLGKVISDFRGVHHNLYRENRPRCTVWDTPLMNSQTPHKMLRTAFLREAGIRFPEGRRRLEDQLFMTRAYFAARSVAIVGDYVCYRYLRRPDGRNAGATPLDPVGYYGNLREVLDVVDHHVEPGPIRDTFYRRFLRTEVLGHLGGRKLLDADAAARRALLGEVQRLLAERFPLRVDDGLGAAIRVRAALARTGTLEDLLGLAREMSQLSLQVQVSDVQATPDTSVALATEATLLYRDEPLALERGNGGVWLLPRSLVGSRVTDRHREVEPLARLGGDLVVAHRDSLDEWFLPTPWQPHLDPDRGTLHWTGAVTLDPRRAAGGSPLRGGRHDLIGRVEVFGLTRNRRARVSDLEPVPLVVDNQGAGHRIGGRRDGQLALDVDIPQRRLARALRRAPVSAGAKGAVTVVLPVVWARPPAVSLLLRGEGGGSRVPLRPTGPASTVWSAAPGPHSPLPPGTYRAVLQLGEPPRRIELETSVEVPPPSRNLSDSLRRVAAKLRPPR